MGSLGSLGSLDSEQLLIASSVQKVRCFQDDASVISCPPTQSSEGTMDSILNELGAVEENESDVQRSVLKEKILKSIRFPRISRDDLNPCEPVTVIGGFPELSKNSQQLMLTELRREVQDLKLLRGRSSLYEVAVIKLRFFQALLCIPDGSDVLENAAVSASTIDIRKVDAFSGIKSINGSNTNRREVNFMSLAAVGREPGHSMSASSKYSQNGGYGGSNLGLHDLNLHIHGKDRITQKWKIDNDAIDELNSEAMNSKVHHRSSSEYDAMPPREDLKAVKNGVSSDTELLQSPKTSIPNFVSNKDLNPDNYSPHNTSEHQGQTGLAEKRKVVKVKEEIYPETAGENPMEERLIKKTRRESSSKKIVKSQESKQVLTVRDGEKMKSVTCPICGNELAVHQQSAAAVLDRHIDRCTRRMETERSQSGRRISSATDFVRGEVMDLACASDEEEAEVSFTKRKIRTHSKSGAGSIRSIYLESDDESVNKSESEVEDAREDYVPGCNEDISESDVDSAADTDDEGPSREPKSKNRGSKKVAASIPGKGVKRKKGQVLPVISEPTLRKKDKRMAEKLLREGRSGRGVNRKGIIEEDKAEVFDDWEDDFYLERLELRGIGEFDEIRPRSPRTVIKEENSDTHSDVENIHAEAVSDGSVSSSKLHQGYIEIDEVLDIDKHTWATLFEYQKEGVRWLFSLYESGVGGILGDEMGLGKTAQLCCHFGSLSRKQRKLRKKNGIFLVVCPATVLQHWLKEFHRWVPAIRCVIMHSISRTGAEVQQLAESGIEYVLRKLQRFEGTQGLVVLITYDGLRRHKESLSMIEWTGVCLDEGQKIRNPDTDISAVCKVLPSYHRIILSGTPIQNSLKELWSLFDFIYPGRLGALSVFELEFCEPIRAGGYRNASKLQAEVAIRCAATLQRIVRPYLLRRKKDDLSSITKLPKKTEQILFCKLSERQKEIYRTILASSEVQSVMDKRMMPFRAINTLRKLCNHPDLVFQTGRIVWQDEKNPAQTKGKKSVGGRNPGSKKSNYGQDYGEDDSDTESPMMDPSKIRWEDSGKLMVLWKVLPLWYSEGHKVLLFTQTHSMLNLLELMMKQFSFRFMRLDGMTPVSKREGIIETFNKDPTVFLMILTTRTGGVGISLTAANRVVLIDPDWNPQTDVQARERAWRLGQLRDVTIYRLICRGTIEEKIYQRQIFKLLLTSRILDDPKQKALFTKSDIKELFQFDDDDEPVVKASRHRQKSDLPEAAQIEMVPQDMHENKYNAGEVHDGIDTEAFVEQQIFPTPSTSSSSSTSSNDTSTEGDGQDSNSRDRRLLQALFDGEALSAVYDHSYMEPGMGGSDAAREARALQKQASQVVDQAIKQLQASAPSYRSSTEQNVHTAVPPNHPGSSSSSSSSQGRFGGGASALMLAGLRATQASVGQTAATAPVTPYSGSSSHSRSTAGSSSERQPQPMQLSIPHRTGSSVTGDILQRLGALFTMSEKDSRAGSRNQGLPTNTILQHFSDLGDQYASVFKDSLHQVAVLKDGKWFRRQPNR